MISSSTQHPCQQGCAKRNSRQCRTNIRDPKDLPIQAGKEIRFRIPQDRQTSERQHGQKQKHLRSIRTQSHFPPPLFAVTAMFITPPLEHIVRLISFGLPRMRTFNGPPSPWKWASSKILSDGPDVITETSTSCRCLCWSRRHLSIFNLLPTILTAWITVA